MGWVVDGRVGDWRVHGVGWCGWLEGSWDVCVMVWVVVGWVVGGFMGWVGVW